MHTIRLAQLAAGSSVGIVGQGPIGQLALQVARALHPDSPVVALDLDPSRLVESMRLGASVGLDPREPDALAEALASLGGGGVQVAVDLSGSGSGVRTAIAITAPLGRVVLSTGMDAELAIPYGQVFGKGLTMVGAFVGARPAEFAADTETFLDLLSNGHVEVDHLSGEPYRPGDAPAVYERVLDGDTSNMAPLFAWK